MTDDTTKTKLQKRLGKDAAAELEAKSADDLRAHLAALAMYEQEIKQSRDADVDLNEAKERAATLAAPFRDALKDNANRRAYAAILLEETGADSGMGADAEVAA